MDKIITQADISENPSTQSSGGYSSIVDEIKQYVNSLGGEDNVFIFGNIAFSHDGEDKIDIGSKLEFGNKNVGEWNDLSLKNEEFGAKLNSRECFSVTKYLLDKGIKILSLSFLEHNNEKELKLFSFDNKEGLSVSYCNESEIQSYNSWGRFKPCFHDEYPAPEGHNDDFAVVAFSRTLAYYNEFHGIVQNHSPSSRSGYIYLIRPQMDLGRGFAALAYMYLRLPLDFKDFEIISQKLSLYFLDVLKKKAETESIKSAKAAIMSRNLSHNLGSHVMSYLKQSLSSVTDMEHSGALADAFRQGVEINKELPYLVGIGRFISYLQERQDYIATVSTDYIPYPSIVNFKDAIYDELNPDYRFMRHSEWKGHKPANILLENIAKSEGLSRNIRGEEQDSNNIIIKFRDFDGLHYDSCKSDYDDLRRWNFSLPGGVMGRQAVFSIIENVIRNSAKHGARKKGENLVLTFDILDPFAHIEDRFFHVYQKAVDKSDFYIVTLTDNVKTDPITVEDTINAVLKKPFSTDVDDLTASNKGLKEMIFSAAWLRGIRIEDFYGEESDSAPILLARNTPEGYLQYVFCLPKVKEVALITDGRLDDMKSSDLWARNGWYVYSLEEYKSLGSKNFNFVIMEDTLSDHYEELRRCSNNRLFVSARKADIKGRGIVFDFDRCCQFCKSEDFDAAGKDLYRQLAFMDEDPFTISIIDQDVRSTAEGSFVKCYDDEKEVRGVSHLYRKHNDTDKEFVGFLHSLKSDGRNLTTALNSIQFIEGITGGNSTDRLVRRCVIDDKWAYQHAHAMKTSVAVFDERLFTKITGYEMSQLGEDNSMKAIDWDSILSEMTDLGARKYVNSYDSVRKKAVQAEFKEFVKYSKEQVVDFAKKHYPQTDPSRKCELRRITPLVYHKKGIDVFTWTKSFDSTNEKSYSIWGLKFDLSGIETDTLHEEWRDNTYGWVEKVADLVFSDGKPEIVFVKNDAVGAGFDYVSVHQGLLDKVYESMPGRLKMAVTKELHCKFVKDSSANDDYLPGLVIHSGRSKPNRKDMPQHQPFIQYAAIENAISDCKYTLVELLDFACYE